MEAGDGVGLGEDAVAIGGNPVAAGRRIVAHRDDDRLLGLQRDDFPQEHLGGVGAAAGAVDAQDDGLHVVVLAQFAQLGRETVAADVGGVAVAVDDLAFQVEDRDDVVAAALAGQARGPGGVDIIAHVDLLEGQRHRGVIAGGRDLPEVVQDITEVGELVDEVIVERGLGPDIAPRYRPVAAAPSGRCAGNRTPPR